MQNSLNMTKNEDLKNIIIMLDYFSQNDLKCIHNS